MSTSYTKSGISCFIIGVILIVWCAIFLKATQQQRMLTDQILVERDVFMAELGVTLDEAAKVDKMAAEDPEIAQQSAVIAYNWNRLMESIKGHWATMPAGKKAFMTAGSYIFTLRRPEHVMGERAFLPGVMIIVFVFIMGGMIITPVKKKTSTT